MKMVRMKKTEEMKPKRRPKTMAELHKYYEQKKLEKLNHSESVISKSEDSLKEVVSL